MSQGAARREKRGAQPAENRKKRTALLLALRLGTPPRLGLAPRLLTPRFGSLFSPRSAHSARFPTLSSASGLDSVGSGCLLQLGYPMPTSRS